MPSYASIPDIFNRQYVTAKSGDSNRPVTGLNPPSSTKDGEQWVMTGTHQYQTNNPKSGNTLHTVPVWSKVQTSSQPATTSQPVAKAPAAPVSVPAAPDAARAQVETRREALQRAEQFKAETAAIPRTPAPSDPLANDFYSSMNAYGRAYVDDYLKGQETEKRRVELGVDENAYFANQSLRNINPATMNISKADTQDDTLDFLKQLRSLIS